MWYVDVYDPATLSFIDGAEFETQEEAEDFAKGYSNYTVDIYQQ